MQINNPVTDYIRRSDYEIVQSIPCIDYGGSGYDPRGVLINGIAESVIYYVTLLPAPYVLSSLEAVVIQNVDNCRIIGFLYAGGDGEAYTEHNQIVNPYIMTEYNINGYFSRINIFDVFSDMNLLSPEDHLYIKIDYSSNTVPTDAYFRNLVATYNIV